MFETVSDWKTDSDIIVNVGIINYVDPSAEGISVDVGTDETANHVYRAAHRKLSQIAKKKGFHLRCLKLELEAVPRVGLTLNVRQGRVLALIARLGRQMEVSHVVLRDCVFVQFISLGRENIEQMIKHGMQFDTSCDTMFELLDKGARAL